MIRRLKNTVFIIACCFLFSCSDSDSENDKINKKPKLSAKEIELVSSVKDEMEIKFFITGDIPEELIKVETELKELLEEIHDCNPKITCTFIDPYSFDQNERNDFMQDLYVNKKIPFINITQETNGATTLKYLFMGGLISYHDAEHSFSLTSLSEKPTGDELAKACKNLIKNSKNGILKQVKRLLIGKPLRIAFLTGHGEANKSQTMLIEKEISKFYWVKRINLKNNEGAFDLHALKEVDGLIICQPQEAFDTQELFIIDQFIMRGGKTIWMIDPVKVDELALQHEGNTIAVANNFGLDDMLFQYGVKLNQDLLLTENCAPIEISPNEGIFNWYFFPLIIPDTSYCSNLSEYPVKLEYSSTVSFINKNESIKKTDLLVTNNKSKIFKAPTRINSEFAKTNDFFGNSTNTKFEVAFVLEGIFNSATKTIIGDENLHEMATNLKYKSVPTKMMIVADGDLILNDTSTLLNTKSGKYETAYLKLSVDKYHLQNPDGSLKFKYGNLEFFMNALDEMMLE